MRTIEFEDVRDRCLSKAHVIEEFLTKHLRVEGMGKVFALADIDAFDGVTLKCDLNTRWNCANNTRASSAATTPTKSTGIPSGRKPMFHVPCPRLD